MADGTLAPARFEEVIGTVVRRAADGGRPVRAFGDMVAPARPGRQLEPQRAVARFYQAHGDGHKSGVGLGLYVSRQIVELHGG